MQSQCLVACGIHPPCHLLSCDIRPVFLTHSPTLFTRSMNLTTLHLPSSPTQALTLDPHEHSVLLQRALLFEAMEKYKAGADDLRTLTRLDPSNRSAAAILTRLNKAAAAMG